MKFGPPHEDAECGVPEYMVSYADMLTIMLAFFVVLFATAGSTDSGAKGEKSSSGESQQAGNGGSQQSENARRERAAAGSTQFIGDLSAGDSGSELVGDEGMARAGSEMDHQSVFNSLRARFGPEWTVANCWNGGPPQLRSGAMAVARGGPGVDNTGKAVWGRRGNDDIKARAPRPGDNALLGGRIHFGEFDATLIDTEKRKLDRAANEIRGKAQKIEIRGHASRRPLPKDAKFRDSWDLAYTRSRAVYEYLVGRGIDPKRIRLATAGDNEPIDSTGTPDPVLHNARVEIHLLNEVVDNPSGLREHDLPQESKDADVPATDAAGRPAPGSTANP